MTIKDGKCRLADVWVHCATCKEDKIWRERRGITECPHGRHSMGLGDLVASVATPIARALKLPCIDPQTKELRPESKCAKKKDWLNKLTQ